MNSTNVVLHNIRHTQQWPKNVAEIWHSLSDSLPRVLISDDIRLRLSPGASELLNEALQSPLVAFEDQENTGSSSCLVSDVIDTILSCARMVKTASSFGKGHEQARISWISVLTILGIAMSEDIFIMEDVKFLRARTTKRLKPMHVEELEGQAAILISSLLPVPLLPDSPTASDAMEVVQPENSEIENGSSSPSEPQESPQAINLPFDAHVLPGRGKRVNCFVPIVCAALEHEIEDLLTSTLCQRYTLNISLPIIGVSLSTSGTTAKIVIGWIDANNDKGEGATVHLASTDGNSSPCPSNGLFDLMDPASMLFFGQFILQLQTHICYVRERSEDIKLRKFCWRLDHIDYDHTDKELDSLSAEVSRTVSWVRDQSHDEIPDSLLDECNLFDTMPPPGNSNKSKSTKGDSGVNESASSKKGSASIDKPTSSKYLGSTGSKIPDQQLLQPPSSSRQPSASNPSRHSASEFAKLAADLGKFEKGMDTWLWERNTLRLHRIQLALISPSSELEIQVNEMVDKYNQFTRISLPPSWTALERIPKSDTVYKKIREELFRDCKAYKSKNPGSADMEDDVCSSISNHISSLFRAVTTSRVCEELVRISEGSESAMRSVWDDLMKAMCCESEDSVSSDFFVEKTIPLPKNQAVKLGAAFPHEHQSQMWEDLIASQSYMATRTRLPTNVRFAVLDFHSLAVQMATTTTNPIVTAADRGFEPGQARADGVCCVRYKLQQAPMLEQKTLETPGKWWMTPFLKRFLDNRSECRGKTPPQTNRQGQPQSQEGLEAIHYGCLMCPAVTESAGPSSSKPKPAHPAETTYEVNLPLIFAEYKRNTVSIDQAFHQGQMYLTFGVEFLAALGVTDFPVWCLITAGIEGTILMAWKSMKSTENASPNATPNPSVNYNVLIDRYTRKFNLTEPLQALQLMACLHRLYKNRHSLTQLVEARLKKNPTLFSQPTDLMLRWMPKPPSPQKKDAKVKTESSV